MVRGIPGAPGAPRLRGKRPREAPARRVRGNRGGRRNRSGTRAAFSAPAVVTHFGRPTLGWATAIILLAAAAVFAAVAEEYNAIGLAGGATREGLGATNVFEAFVP